MIETTWNKALSLLRNPILRQGVVILLALFGIANLILWVAIIRNDKTASMPPYCTKSNEGIYTCPIMTECLDKAGCYAKRGFFSAGEPWCLFGEDMSPEVCEDSNWLRKYLNPERLTSE